MRFVPKLFSLTYGEMFMKELHFRACNLKGKHVDNRTQTFSSQKKIPAMSLLNSGSGRKSGLVH